jgi:hypothetical protein
MKVPKTSWFCKVAAATTVMLYFAITTLITIVVLMWILLRMTKGLGVL